MTAQLAGRSADRAAVQRRRLHLPPQPSRTARWAYAAAAIAVASLGGFSVGWSPEVTGVLVVGGTLLVLLLGQVQLAVLAVVAASVFEGYLETVTPVATTGLVLVAVGAWAIRRSHGRLHSGRRSPVLLAALALTVALLISTVFHNLGSQSTMTLGRWAGFIALLVILTDCMRDRLRPEQVVRVYVVACAVASVCALAAYFLVEGRRVGGPLSDSDDFAFYLLAALPLGIAVRRLGRRAWPWDIATAVTALAVLGTLSRGALVGLLVMVVFALAARQIPWRAVALLLVVVVTAGSLAVSVRPELLSSSSFESSAVADEGVSERLDLWQAAAEMALDSPLVGHGPGSFAAEHDRYLPPQSAEVPHRPDVASNTYVEIAAESGLLGLAAFLLVLAAGFSGAWAWWRRTRAPVAAGLTSSLVGTAVAATFVTAQFSLPLWLLCAVGAALRHAADQMPPATGAPAETTAATAAGGGLR